MDSMMTKEDEGKIKYRELHGQAYKIYCTDPYGFWYIQKVEGVTPKELEGTFTSFMIANRALEGYVKPVPITEPAPPIEEKKEITGG